MDIHLATVSAHRAQGSSLARRAHTVSTRLLTYRARGSSYIEHKAPYAQVSKCLGDLGSSFYRHSVSGAHVVLWELRVLAVRLQALGFGDWRRGVMGCYEEAEGARRGTGRPGGF